MPTRALAADRRLAAHIAFGRAADRLFVRLLVLSAVAGVLLVTAGLVTGRPHTPPPGPPATPGR